MRDVGIQKTDPVSTTLTYCAAYSVHFASNWLCQRSCLHLQASAPRSDHVDAASTTNSTATAG